MILPFGDQCAVAILLECEVTRPISLSSLLSSQLSAVLRVVVAGQDSDKSLLYLGDHLLYSRPVCVGFKSLGLKRMPSC